ncbi:MAG: DUF368 domain-containing protein, partial [Eubacteriales bacterium]|nr:DUF368 domain-containing protein [Eubacteriales bacterium]
MKNELKYCFKCFICGFAMCVPGLSGGSMAILLGIYKNMMEIAGGFISKPKKYLKSLFVTGISCFAGAVLFTLLPGRYAAAHENAFLIASAVIVALSLPFYIKNSAIKHLNIKALLYITAGSAALFVINIILNSGNIPANQTFGVFSYFLAGFILSVSLILPGISFPYMLAFIGIYGNVMTAFNRFDTAVLLPLGIGTILGIIVLSKFILKIMEKYTFETDCFLLGFTAASV